MLEDIVQPAKLTLVDVDESPFEDIATIHALYEARIFRFLLFSVRDRDIALSLTQDTFLKAWRSRSDFRGDCSIITWLTHIAVSLLRSHTRTQTFRFWKKASTVDIGDIAAVGMELSHPTASAEHALLAHERLAAVWRSVEQLSAQQRTIFLLRFVEEMDLQDIATSTGIALPTVKSHLYRALDRVRAEVKTNQGGTA